MAVAVAVGSWTVGDMTHGWSPPHPSTSRRRRHQRRDSLANPQCRELRRPEEVRQREEKEEEEEEDASCFLAEDDCGGMNGRLSLI